MSKYFLSNISRTKFDQLCENGFVDELQPHRADLLRYFQDASGIEVSRILPSLLSHPRTAQWFFTAVEESALDPSRVQYSHSDYHPMLSASLLRGDRLRGPRALLLTWLSTKNHFLGVQSLTQGWIKDAKPHVFLNYLLRASASEPHDTFGHTMSFASRVSNFSILNYQGPLALISNNISLQARDSDTAKYAKTFGPHIGLRRFSNYILEYWDTSPEPPEPCLLTTWLYIRRSYKNEWTPLVLELLRKAAHKSPKEFVAICVLSLFDAQHHSSMQSPTLTEKQQRHVFSFMQHNHPWKNALLTASEIGVLETIFKHFEEHPWFKNYWITSKTMPEYVMAEDIMQLVSSYFPDTNLVTALDLNIDFDF